MKIRDIWLGSESESESAFVQLGTADSDCDIDPDADADSDPERLGYNFIFGAVMPNLCPGTDDSSVQTALRFPITKGQTCHILICIGVY
jgi:hypothetical protein